MSVSVDGCEPVVKLCAVKSALDRAPPTVMLETSVRSVWAAAGEAEHCQRERRREGWRDKDRADFGPGDPSSAPLPATRTCAGYAWRASLPRFMRAAPETPAQCRAAQPVTVNAMRSFAPIYVHSECSAQPEKPSFIIMKRVVFPDFNITITLLLRDRIYATEKHIRNLYPDQNRPLLYILIHATHFGKPGVSVRIVNHNNKTRQDFTEMEQQLRKLPDSPRYQSLVRRRRRVTWLLTSWGVLQFGVYFGAIAWLPAWSGTIWPAGSATSLILWLTALVIVLSVVISAVYIWWTGRFFDPERAAILKALRDE